MTASGYEKLSKELQEMCACIPLKWGKIQNDTTDAKCDLFKIKDKQQLEITIADFSKEDKNYFRRRWFLWQCAKIDEYLFYNQTGVFKNPNRKDKNWDVEFNNNPKLQFDIKSTVIPKKLQRNFSLADEEKIIHYYYNNQSTGIRNHYQNRLFIVHHSYYNQERSLFLRCHWNLKQKAFQEFVRSLNNQLNFITYKNVIAKCIFIFESKDKVCSYKII